jgi:hypothetical protein
VPDLHSDRHSRGVSANHGDELVSHPVDTRANAFARLSTPCLEFAKLIGRERARVGFRMMVTAQGDHPCRIVVLPFIPRRIEVVPREVRTGASFDWADVADLLA